MGGSLWRWVAGSSWLLLLSAFRTPSHLAKAASLRSSRLRWALCLVCCPWIVGAIVSVAPVSLVCHFVVAVGTRCCGESRANVDHQHIRSTHFACGVWYQSRLLSSQWLGGNGGWYTHSECAGRGHKAPGRGRVSPGPFSVPGSRPSVLVNSECSLHEKRLKAPKALNIARLKQVKPV